MERLPLVRADLSVCRPAGLFLGEGVPALASASPGVHRGGGGQERALDLVRRVRIFADGLPARRGPAQGAGLLQLLERLGQAL